MYRHDLLHVPDHLFVEVRTKGGIGQCQAGEVERAHPAEQAGRDQQLHRQQPGLAEQLESDHGPNRLPYPRLLDRCRNGEQPERDEEEQDEEPNEKRLHQLADEHQEYKVHALLPGQPARWGACSSGNLRQRLGRRARELFRDARPVARALDGLDLVAGAGDHEHGRDDQQQPDHRRKVTTAQGMRGLPQLRGEQKEHDQDEQYGEGAGHERRDLAQLGAEMPQCPTGDLDKPEAGDDVDDTDAEQNVRSHAEDDAGGPVDDRGDNPRNEPDHRDVERVESHPRAKRRTPAIPEVESERRRGHHQGDRHADEVLGKRRVRPLRPDQDGPHHDPRTDERHGARVHPLLGAVARDELRHATSGEPALDQAAAIHDGR